MKPAILLILVALTIAASRYGKVENSRLGEVKLAESPRAGEIKVPHFANTGDRFDGTNWFDAKGNLISADRKAFVLTTRTIVERLTDTELAAIDKAINPSVIRVKWMLLSSTEFRSDGPVVTEARKMFTRERADEIFGEP